MQNVTIIGLGLIGGSIGLALRRWSQANGGALRIVGYDEDMDKQTRAKRMDAVDVTEWSLANAVTDADIVVVATPVGAMSTVFENIAPSLKEGAVVTDTGSTKADVLAAARNLPDHVQFVGGHPMAGKSESLEAADADLFAGATWVICPSVTASETAVQSVLGIVAACGAEAYFTDPVEHDSYVAGISHLPFLISATLINTVSADPAWRDMRTLAASGFRDTTRLALGNPIMHRDILLSNRAAAIRWIDQVTAALGDVRAMLEREDEDAGKAIFDYLSHAQDERARLEAGIRRSDEQATPGSDSVSNQGVGDQVSRMFLGGFGRKKRDDRSKS
jgi:prephenate dehydrogenase